MAAASVDPGVAVQCAVQHGMHQKAGTRSRSSMKWGREGKNTNDERSELPRFQFVRTRVGAVVLVSVKSEQ